MKEEDIIKEENKIRENLVQLVYRLNKLEKLKDKIIIKIDITRSEIKFIGDTLYK